MSNLKEKSRLRSKRASVSYVENDNGNETDESFKSVDDKKKKTNTKIQKNTSSWTPEEQLTLLCEIQKNIPRKDNLPFDERMKKLDWFHIHVNDRSRSEIKTEFENILESTRTFRILEEIVKDMHTEILPKLGLEKPRPAFVMFCQDYKEEIEQTMKENPKKGSFTNIGGIMFNECSPEIRESYKEKAKAARDEYDRLMSKYELPKGKREFKGKAVKYTPMSCYLQEKLQKNPNALKLSLRKEYSNLSRKQKLKWILRWLGIEKGEKANLDQYLKCLESLTKTELDIFNEYEGRPKAAKAYNMFMRDKLNNKNSDSNSSHLENFKSTVYEWKNLPENIKNEYVAKAKELKQNFTADFTRFVASLPTDRHDYEIKLLSRKNAGKKGKSKRTKKSKDVVSDEDDNHEEILKNEEEYEGDDYEQDDEYPDEDENEEIFRDVTMNVTQTINSANKSNSFKSPVDADDNHSEKDDEDETGSYSNEDDDRNETIFQCDTSDWQRNLKSEKSNENNSNKSNVEELPKNNKALPMTVVHSTPIADETTSKASKAKKSIANTQSPRKTGQKDKQLLIDQMLTPKANHSADSDEEEIPSTYASNTQMDKHSKSSDQTDLQTWIKEEPASDSSGMTPQKKRKLSSGETTDAKKLKGDQSTDEVKKERTVYIEKKYRKILSRKPAESLLEYYALMHFEGSMKKAKKSLNALPDEERQSIETSYINAKKKYAKKFQAFAMTLDPHELEHFSSLFERN